MHQPRPTSDSTTPGTRAPGPTLLDELDRRQDDICRQLDALNEQIEQLVAQLLNRPATCVPEAAAQS